MLEILVNMQPGNRGEIVFCQQEGASWGACECLDKFLVVKIDGYYSKTELMARSDAGSPTKFDIDAAFTEAELAEIGASNWMVKEKSSAYIVSNN